MADTNFRIGQFRRDQITDWDSINIFLAENIFYNVEYITNPDVTDFTFNDYCLKCKDSNIFTSQKTYYIKFFVPRVKGRSQDYIFELRHDDENESISQSLREFHVNQKNDSEGNDQYDYFEYIFTPNNDYDILCFRLKRTVEDYTSERNEDGSIGLEPLIAILDLREIGNIINSLQTLNESYGNLTTLKKIGIQGPPGMLFTVNGEEMVINRTGIYELYHEDILITYLGFILKNADFTQDGGKQDFFILDFRY